MRKSKKTSALSGGDSRVPTAFRRPSTGSGRPSGFASHRPRGGGSERLPDQVAACVGASLSVKVLSPRLDAETRNYVEGYPAGATRGSYRWYTAVVRGAALESKGTALELYVKALNLRFVLPLLDYFGCGADPVSKRPPPEVTRHGALPSTPVVDDARDGVRCDRRDWKGDMQVRHDDELDPDGIELEAGFLALFVTQGALQQHPPGVRGRGW